MFETLMLLKTAQCAISPVAPFFQALKLLVYLIGLSSFSFGARKIPILHLQLQVVFLALSVCNALYLKFIQFIYECRSSQTNADGLLMKMEGSAIYLNVVVIGVERIGDRYR